MPSLNLRHLVWPSQLRPRLLSCLVSAENGNNDGMSQRGSRRVCRAVIFGEDGAGDERSLVEHQTAQSAFMRFL
jgi:hypothetical protein